MYSKKCSLLSRWNGRERTTTEMWPQQTQIVGMEEEEPPPKCDLSKHQEHTWTAEGALYSADEMEEEERPPKCGLSKHQEHTWTAEGALYSADEMGEEEDHRNVASARTKRCSLFCSWNGRGRTTTEMWPQQTPGDEMGEEEDHRNVASARTKSRWNVRGTTTSEMWPQQTQSRWNGRGRRPQKCGLSKHQELEWKRKNDHRNVASANTRRWNGRGRTTTEMWPQQALRADGMGEEEDHRNVASANTKNWNGRGRTTTEMWPQQTPGDGMEEEERPPKCGLSKHQDLSLSFFPMFSGIIKMLLLM
ncbi:uncharacterized protein LOC135371270 [Ornithodoros turicata]|uniref:uncharacterized protein LOC135371270 n=1 Tax=Ornithodoros turicata TaxID=34597 RepID=UPI0031396553